jgi:hypothetical protein
VEIAIQSVVNGQQKTSKVRSGLVSIVARSPPTPAPTSTVKSAAGAREVFSAGALGLSAIATFLML